MFDLSNTEAFIDPGRLCRSVFSYQDVSDWADLISDECHRFNDAENSSIDVLSPRRYERLNEMSRGNFPANDSGHKKFNWCPAASTQSSVVMSKIHPPLARTLL